MDRSTLINLILVGMVLMNLSWTYGMYNHTNELEDRMEAVETEQEDLKDFIVGSAGDANRTGEFASDSETTAQVLAYDGEEDTGKLVTVTVTSLPGDGVYLNVENVNMRATTQASIKNANTAVKNSSVPPRYNAVAVELDVPSEWDYVSGGSAGLPIAVAIASTHPDYRLNESVVLTGGIDSEGRVQSVEYVREKAIAARENGKDTIVVPPGQKVDVDGIQVVVAVTLEDALEYGLDPAPSSAQQSLSTPEIADGGGSGAPSLSVADHRVGTYGTPA